MHVNKESTVVKQSVLRGLLVAGGMALSASSWANCPAPITLPAPGNPSTSVLFGDAVVYALPLLGLSVDSSPGQIGDCIVVGSGAGGNVQINSANAATSGIDNAYDNLQGDSNPYFRTGDTTNNLDPGGANQFVGDQANTWDIRLSALSTYLAGGSLMFMFNHNQTNADTTQDLFVWAQIALRNTTTGAAVYFYATAMTNTTGLTNFGLPGGNPLSYTGPQTAATSTYPSASAAAGQFPTAAECSANGGADGLPLCSSGTGANHFIRARGHVCLDANDIPVLCGSPQDNVNNFINDNLGANQVANAVLFPEIDALLATANFSGYDVMSIDWRMGCNNFLPDSGGDGVANTVGCPTGSVLNNGYEQLFIIGIPNSVTKVSEPGALALVGLMLLGLGIVGRRRLS
jgi:hypothetical protein